MFGLAVDVDQQLTQLLDHGQRHAAAVDARAEETGKLDRFGVDVRAKAIEILKQKIAGG